MNIAQIQDLARSVGFPDPELAAAVAMAESGGNPGAIGDLSLGVSVGLWQINLASHPQYTQDELTDPETNARAALAISSNGTNWNPWTTYRTGAYRQYIRAPAGNLLAPLLVAGSLLFLAATAANYLVPGSVPMPRALRI